MEIRGDGYRPHVLVAVHDFHLRLDVLYFLHCAIYHRVEIVRVFIVRLACAVLIARIQMKRFPHFAHIHLFVALTYTKHSLRTLVKEIICEFQLQSKWTNALRERPFCLDNRSLLMITCREMTALREPFEYTHMVEESIDSN